MGTIAGFNTMSSLAANRVRLLMAQTDMNRVADLIADILHYCNEEEIDFGYELDIAHSYVNEEESFDNLDEENDRA
jgi:hypothetical protein